MLNDLEVLAEPDANFWMKSAYLIPDRPNANMAPGETGVKLVPISRMNPRSFITNLKRGDRVRANQPLEVRGIAFGGDCGVQAVDLSADGGSSWLPTRLGGDEGQYSFRRWQLDLTLPPGEHVLMVRCKNTKDEVQPPTANWNPSGYMRNVIEKTSIAAT